jgi:outer membrane autotransporter protein
MNNLNLGMDQGGGNETVTQENALPEDVSAFIAGGYIDGKSDPMRGAITTGRDKFDGWYGAAGIEKMIGDDAVIGLAASYSELKGNTGIGDTARARLYQATVYGNWDLGGVVLDGVGSAGTLTSKTKRAFAVGTTPYTLRGSDQQLALSGEIGIGAPLGGDAFTITPRASLRGAYISGGNLAEYGGDTALVIHRHAIQSAQGRLGATAKIDVGGFKPYLTANYVHEFRDQPAYFLANFVGGTGSLAPFALGGSDKNWGEVGGGLTLSTGNVDISLSADTTAWRGNLSYQSYRAALKFRF